MDHTAHWTPLGWRTPRRQTTESGFTWRHQTSFSLPQEEGVRVARRRRWSILGHGGSNHWFFCYRARTWRWRALQAPWVCSGDNFIVAINLTRTSPDCAAPHAKTEGGPQCLQWRPSTNNSYTVCNRPAQQGASRVGCPVLCRQGARSCLRFPLSSVAGGNPLPELASVI